MNLNVREMEVEDVPLVVNYWMNAAPDFLVGMGVDLDKMPNNETLTNMLMVQSNTPIKERKSYALIWEMDGIPVGHSNVNNIEFAKTAKMHLHLWNAHNRKSGAGLQLIKKSIPLYFKNLQLERLVCEPYAENPAPNKTLKKAGFKFIKKHRTIPGYLNFEQEVNRWELTKFEFEDLI